LGFGFQFIIILKKEFLGISMIRTVSSVLNDVLIFVNKPFHQEIEIHVHHSNNFGLIKNLMLLQIKKGVVKVEVYFTESTSSLLEV
jgi:hypothetical protein